MTRPAPSSPDLSELTSYKGWVAWVGGRPSTMPDGSGGHMTAWEGGTPIFEAVPHQPELTSAVEGARELPTRRPDRRTVAWEDLPHERVNVLELYAFRDVWRDQPVVRLDRPERAPEGWRWIQMKLGGVVAPATPASMLDGQRRTGIQGWRIGCYNPRSQQGRRAIMVEVRPDDGSVDREDLLGHPCWPRPHGWGLAPKVLGLDPGDVPSAPDPAGVR